MIKWRYHIFFGHRVTHDRERVQGFMETRRPETAGRLMQLFQAVNCSRIAEVQDLVDEQLTHMARTTHVTNRMASGDDDWITEGPEPSRRYTRMSRNIGML